MPTLPLRSIVAPLLLPVVPAVALVSDIVVDRPAPPAVYAHLDAAPPGVDIRRKPSLAELRNIVRPNLFPGRPSAQGQRLPGAGAAPRGGADGQAPVTAAAPPIPAGDPGLPNLTAHVAPSCSGTGSDGQRVQVIYAVEQGKTDRYNDLLPMLRSWVADVDDTFAMSSQKTNGGLRVRWVYDKCVPVIAHELLPARALSGGFSATMDALKARGYTNKARKYLVFADDTTLCGIGQMYRDSAKTSNVNNGAYPMFARVDSGCWSFPENWHSTAAHELIHTLGGVQPDAPHGTNGGHCRDEEDAMCYDDDGSGSVTVEQVCRNNSGNEGLFDCQNDDYFHTAAAAGSYLATHWNAADSSFLDKVGALPAPPTVTMSGPSGVRAGLSATFSATSNTPVSYTWSASPAECLPGTKTGSSAEVMCPSYYTGSVRLSVSGAASSGIAGSATRTVTLTTSPKASITVRLATSAGSITSGKSAQLTGTLRYGGAAVRGYVSLYAAPASGGSYSKIAGPMDTGTDGAYSWTVSPKKSTQYALVVSYNESAGWGTPAQGSTTVKVS